jgi:hypothetical protein
MATLRQGLRRSDRSSSRIVTHTFRGGTTATGRRQRRLPLPWAYPPAGHFMVYFAIREGRGAWEGGLLDDD